MGKKFSNVKKGDTIYFINVMNSSILMNGNNSVNELKVLNVLPDCLDAKCLAFSLDNYSSISPERNKEAYVVEPVSKIAPTDAVVVKIYSPTEKTCIETAIQYLKKRKWNYEGTEYQIKGHIAATTNMMIELINRLETAKEDEMSLEEFATMPLTE